MHNVIPTAADPIMNWVLEAYDMNTERYPDAEFWEFPAAACAMMVQESLMFDEVLFFFELMGGDSYSDYYGSGDIEYDAWNYNRTGIIEQF